MSYLIKPTSMRTGVQAPGMISNMERPEDAIADVRSRSGLGKFKDWSFGSSVKHIKDKQVKRFNNQDNE